MVQPNSQPKNSRPQGADNRAYPRTSLRLAATCASGTGGTQRTCEIRNFCPGGLLLNFSARDRRDYLPVVGDIIDISSSWPDGPEAQHFAFKARIVHANPDSAGVALIKPDPEALRILMRCSESQRNDRPDLTDADDHSPLDSGTAGSLLKACRDHVLRSSRRLVDDVIKNLSEELYGHANQAGNLNDLNVCMDAHGMIKRQQQELGEQFLSSLAEQLEHPEDPVPQHTAQEGALTLLDDEALEDWISISEISNHVESRLNGPLTELEHRLSRLTGQSIDHQNNPFGPHVFVQAFQRMLNPLQPVRPVRRISFQVFKLILTGWLETLYRDLNGLMIERGILPDLKQKIVRMNNRDETVPDRPYGSGEGDSPETSESASGTAENPASHEGLAGEHLPATEPGTRGSVHTGDYRNLYALVQDLRQLQRQYGYSGRPAVDPAAAASAPNAGDNPDGHPAAATSAGAEAIQAPAMDATSSVAVEGHAGSGTAVSSDEILAALSQIQQEDHGAVHGDDQEITVGDLRGRILSAVPVHGSDGQPRRISGREAGIIDVADTLFTSMRGDGLVADSVRSWLRRLEIPLLKLAMLDESLFLDRGHAARKVVNRIAQLELYESRDNTGSALHREIDKLVDHINSEEQPDAAVFAKALKKLDLLIRVQDEAYAENLKDVLASCEADPDASMPDTPDTADEEHDSEADEPHRQWLKRILRMKVGDWVMFATDPATPRRLRLAWISKNQDRYVFVNVRGLKEASYDANHLARYFASGDAVIMDTVDEPALDRAQYSMLQNLHRQLLHETTHDQLTGLINRREFERHMQDLLEKTRCTGIESSLIHLDLAQFNTINNTCGYNAGDQALTEIARLLEDTAGGNSIIGRIGSDEFGILLPDHTHEGTLAVGQDLLEAIRNYHFSWRDESFVISAALGVVHFETFDNVSELLQAAESSCRASRSQGINKLQVFRSDDPTQSIHNDTARWLSRIDKALSEDTLDLRYQRIMPVGNTESHEIAHHSEVLLGITDETGTLISPQEFIITAEHYQRMPAIDRWVIRKMFRFIIEHRDILNKAGGFAINLSGCSLSDESFKDFIREEITKTGVPMEYVCFEVTETAGITSLSDTAEFIQEIKQTGCTFSLDDFGSGLSSYVYLKNLPVDYLKIDGGFVREMDQNPADFAVVKSITEIGHFMDKKIIAESVESEDVLEQLREIGVDYVQGYAIERPLRLQELL